MSISGDRRLTPEQLEQKEKNKKLAKSELATLRRSIRETFATDAGQVTLRWLMTVCGYQIPVTTIDPQTREVQINNIIHNGALQGLYLKIRAGVDEETLIAVEHKSMRQDEKEE